MPPRLDDALWDQVYAQCDRDARVDLLAAVDEVEIDFLRADSPFVQLPEDGELIFGAFVEGAVALAVAEFQAQLQPLAAVVELPAARAAARDVATKVQFEQVVRPLIALMARRSAAGELSGVTPEERYVDFCDWLTTSAGLAAIDAAYPGLRSYAGGVVAHRLDGLRMLLTRTVEHWPVVREGLGLAADERVVAIDPGAGDTHNGRSVCIFTLSSGVRIACKPRSLAMEIEYTRLTRWLGALIGVEMPQPAMITTTDVGWSEYIENPQGVEHADLHAMLGVHLAALYLTRSIDVHYENLRLDKHGRPVVIDAEAMLTPELSNSGRPADRLLDATGSGLLRISVASGEGSFDFGALDYQPGRLSPFNSWEIVRPFRDDMHLRTTRAVIDADGGLPRDSRTRHHADALLAAFESALRRALSFRSQLLAHLRTHLAGTTTRYIHRPTMTYALVARMATHPAFSAPTDRRRVLGQLACMDTAGLSSIIESEMRQLAAGDIPFFQVDAGSTVVRDAAGCDTGVRVQTPPIAGVLRAIEALRVTDVEEAVARTRSSLLHWGRQQRAITTGLKERPRQEGPCRNESTKRQHIKGKGERRNDLSNTRNC